MTDQQPASTKRRRESEPAREPALSLKRRISPYRQSLLRADLVLTNSAPVRTAADTANARIVESFLPWRYNKVPATADTSIGAFVFEQKFANFFESIWDSFDTSPTGAALAFSRVFYNLVFPVEPARRDAAAVALLQLMFARFPASQIVRQLARTIGTLVADGMRINSVSDDVFLLLFELSKNDAALGIVNLLSLPDLNDQSRRLSQRLVLAFADARTRAALCSTDRYFANLCRTSRDGIAEFRFLALLRDVREMSQESLAQLCEVRHTMFDDTVSQADFYRAAVSADEFIQTCRAPNGFAESSTKRAWRRFVDAFGIGKGYERAALLPRDARNYGTTREDRRYQTARLAVWMLQQRGGEDAALAAEIFTQFIDLKAENYRLAPWSDMVHADGTVYDGRTVFQALRDIAEAGDFSDVALWSNIRFERCGVDLLRVLYAQDNSLDFWAQDEEMRNTEKCLFLETALYERDDTHEERKRVARYRIVQKLVDIFDFGSYRDERRELVNAYARDHPNALIWRTFLGQVTNRFRAQLVLLALLEVCGIFLRNAGALGAERLPIYRLVARNVATVLESNTFDVPPAAIALWNCLLPADVWSLALAEMLATVNGTQGFERLVMLEKQFVVGEQDAAQALVREYIAFYNEVQHETFYKSREFAAYADVPPAPPPPPPEQPLPVDDI